MSPSLPEVLAFRPGYPMAAVIAMGGAALLVAAASYVRVYKSVPAATRASLVALRLLAVATVIFCMAGPVWSRRETIVEKGSAIIALDVSKSMNIQDERKVTRFEAAEAMLAECSDEISELSESLELQKVRFAADAKQGDLGGEAMGGSTDLAGMLDYATREGGADCAGVLIVSDGRDNVGGDVLRKAARLGKMGIPIWAVGVGRDQMPEDFIDLRVEDLKCPERAFIGNRMTVSAKLGSALQQPEDVTVTLKVDGKVEGEPLVVRCGGGTRSSDVSFTYIPAAIGVHRVEMSVAPVEGERNVANNVARTFFRVFASKLNVLYIEGELRWEFKFLRRTLAGARDVELSSVSLFRDGGRVLPRTEREWKSIRCLILGDVPAGRLDAGALEMIPGFVEAGGALLVIGGRNNLGPGGYGETPLAKVLPVKLSLEDAEIPGPLDIRTTTAGRSHPVARLADDLVESERLWRRLPELPAVRGVLSVKPAARTILTAGPREPLMVLQDYGEGRSCVFLADTTWKWIFAEDAFPEAHRRFWRQLVSYLTRHDYGEKGRALFVETDKMRYRAGEKALVTAYAGSSEGVEGAQVLATVSAPGGGVTEMKLGAGPGEHEAKLPLRRPGDYVITARLVAAGGEELATDETRFTVVEVDLEDENPAADPALMAELAKLSGGGFFPVSEMRAALARIKSRNVTTEKTVERVRAAWNTPWTAGLFMLLLSIEWAVRKRKGLS